MGLLAVCALIGSLVFVSPLRGCPRAGAEDRHTRIPPPLSLTVSVKRTPARLQHAGQKSRNRP